MKKLLYIFVAISIIFSACEEEDAAPTPSGTIADVVGVWQLQGLYDAANQSVFDNIEQENCALQSTVTLESNGNGLNTDYQLENMISGPCISSTIGFTFSYINSTTLEYIFFPGTPLEISRTVTLNTPTTLMVPISNNGGNLDGSYGLWEKQ